MCPCWSQPPVGYTETIITCSQRDKVLVLSKRSCYDVAKLNYESRVIFTTVRLSRMSHTSKVFAWGLNLDYFWLLFDTDERARESHGHCLVCCLLHLPVVFHSHAMICFEFTFPSHSLHFLSISHLAMCLWMNACVLVDLFICFGEPQASELRRNHHFA